MRPEDSRRSFLREATALAVPGLVLAASSNVTASQPKRAFPPPRVTVDPIVSRVLIREIQADEAAHVPILQKLPTTRTTLSRTRFGRCPS